MSRIYFVKISKICGYISVAFSNQLSTIFFACSREPAKVSTSNKVVLFSVTLHFTLYSVSLCGIKSAVIERDSSTSSKFSFKFVLIRSLVIPGIISPIKFRVLIPSGVNL